MEEIKCFPNYPEHFKFVQDRSKQLREQFVPLLSELRPTPHHQFSAVTDMYTISARMNGYGEERHLPIIQ